MNREIKFRAWHKGVMTYKHSFNLNIAGEVYYLDTTGEWVQDEIKEVVLLQFTGLKDKNGKEIYEGDILRDVNDDEDIYQLFYNEESVSFEIAIPETPGFVCGSAMSISKEYAGGYMEVIGNIYENPELLK